MPKKMLIDAAHPEETRVAVLDGTRVDDFDFETQSKRQLRGNIYLAKVTRVEPSLQAAFVEFGGNRHGFLAFGEIHPDYYQIPTADREALKAEFEALSARPKERKRPAKAEAAPAPIPSVEDDEDADADTDAEAVDESEIEAHAESGDDGEASHEAKSNDVEDDDDDDDVDDDAEAERRRRMLTRRYKIQEVIRRRQIMLVQVVKEERGNKGAALTTYLSLAGRYCVLMPNSGRGGGISRKISAGADRKRLKKIATELDVPAGMGLIVRTAGAKRTKTEIKRDYEYLMRAWETIRDQTLRSVAPAMIYEESSLVKRAIRDLYDKDVDEIYVEGEGAYREAKDFVRMLMPSHAKKVHHYREPTPIFSANHIERQLDTVFSPVVHLKSGGYIVINQTEALVAIDVNSGRATRERGIEQTALKTNLEAADEAARQMRLRDLAGLIVIDFIDMEDSKNDRAVEKRMKDALRFDRARVQAGKISSFGLMELSRQRRRMSILEGSSHVCAHCGGAGHVRSIESSALHLLRALDEHAKQHHAQIIEARAPAEVALYVLNEKRETIARLEDGRGVQIRVVSAPNLLPPDFELNTIGEAHIDHEAIEARAPRPAPVDEHDDDDAIVDEVDDEEAEETSAEPVSADAERGEGRDGRRRRRRGRRGGKRQRENGADASHAPVEALEGEAEEAGEDGEDEEAVAAEGNGDQQGERAGGRRRRRRRRGRGGRRPEGDQGEGAIHADAPQPYEDVTPEREAYQQDFQPAPAPVAEEAPEPPRYEPPRYEPAPAYQPEPPRPALVETSASILYQDAPAPEAVEPEPQAPAPVAEVDYAPDQERREKFFARLSRWGKKEAD